MCLLKKQILKRVKEIFNPFLFAIIESFCYNNES